MIRKKFKQKYKAKLVALPAKWNSFHYVVETDSENDSKKVIYFSEAAPGKPPVDMTIGTEGEVGFDGLIHYWLPLESKKESDYLEEWLETPIKT